MGLLAGVACSYAAAWWLMNHREVEEPYLGLLQELPVDPRELPRSVQHGWRVTVWQGAGVAAVFSERLQVVYAGDPHVLVFPNEDTPIPSWSVAMKEEARVDAAAPMRNAVVTERAAGWPLAAVVERHVRTAWGAGAQVTPQSLGTVSFAWQRSGGGETMLAMTPIWAGMAGDAVLFGAVWLAAGVLVVKLRERVMRRGNRCRGCGYELTGLKGDVCPECGRGFARETRA